MSDNKNICTCEHPDCILQDKKSFDKWIVNNEISKFIYDNNDQKKIQVNNEDE